MPAWLYDAGPLGLPIFLFATVTLGGLAAFVTGRALAQKWCPPWQILVYSLLLAAGVRFIHVSIFAEPLLSLRSYLLDFAILFVFGIAGYQLTRANQMTVQYRWRSRRGT
jgi:hypothetical protein